jgi:ribosomal protein L19
MAEEFRVGDKVRVKKCLLDSLEKGTKNAFSGTLIVVATEGGVVKIKNKSGSTLTLTATRHLQKV